MCSALRGTSHRGLIIGKWLQSLAFASCASVSAMLATPLTAAEARINRILVEYVPPTNPNHEELYQLLKDKRSLERLQEIFSPFRLPIDLTLRMIGCDGGSNAW